MRPSSLTVPLPTAYELGTRQSLSPKATFTGTSHRVTTEPCHLPSPSLQSRCPLSLVRSSGFRTRIGAWPLGTQAGGAREVLEGIGHFQSTERPGEEKRPYFKVNSPLIELKREHAWGFKKGEKPFVHWSPIARQCSYQHNLQEPSARNNLSAHQ